MMWSETRDNHVFVYWWGVLIYKRWARCGSLADGRGVVFDEYGPSWAAGRDDMKGDRS